VLSFAAAVGARDSVPSRVANRSGIPTQDWSPNAMSQDLRERFLATPLVTRHLAASLWMALVFNVLCGFDDLVCASPYDITRQLQVWRLVTSMFYVPGVISALFLSFMMYCLGSRWEKELGSLRFGWYILAIGVCFTNAVTCVCAILVSPVVPHVLEHTFVCQPGLQNALFVLFARIAGGFPGDAIAVGGQSFRVRKKQVPLFLFVSFVLFGAHPVEALSCVLTGWAWATGSLGPKVVPPQSWFARVERHQKMQRMVNAAGYVSTAAATPTLPVSGGAPDGERGFWTHVNDHPFEERNSASASLSGGHANGSGFGDAGSSLGVGRRLGESVVETRRETEPAHWRVTSRPTTREPSFGFTQGGVAPGPPGVPSNRDGISLSSAPGGNAPPRGTAGGGREGAPNKNDHPTRNEPQTFESREARAASLATAHERRLKLEQHTGDADLR
jgi:membrane associated rhomboid family serine protease